MNKEIMTKVAAFAATALVGVSATLIGIKAHEKLAATFAKTKEEIPVVDVETEQTED